MYYNRPPSPSNRWPSPVQYSSYQSDRRRKLLWLPILAVGTLVLSVAALIIVFAVEHSWFSDNFRQTPSYYGLWRLCFFANLTCDSWFSSTGPISTSIEARYNQDRVGINAWQALEIVFLFLTTSTLLFAFAAVVCYRLRRSIHYYLIILAAFAVWPAAAIGVSALFVFGFSVYNVSPTPHRLEWCFYVNMVAVILTVISGILLTVYDIFLKRPSTAHREVGVINLPANFNGYSAPLTPSTYVVVPRKKKNKRKEPYDYPQVLYPHQYLPSGTVNSSTNTDFVANPNHHMLTTPFSTEINNPPTSSARPPHPSMNSSRGAGLLASHSAVSLPPPTQFYPPPVPAYPYQQPHWHRTGVNYNNHEPPNDYIQRGLYRPARLNPIERPFDHRDEPRILHHYTGYNHFSAIDAGDSIRTRNQSSSMRSGSPVRYPANPPYYHQSAYIKSAL